MTTDEGGHGVAKPFGSQAPSVTFKPGFPSAYSDAELDHLLAEASGQFIWVAVNRSAVDDVMRSGETLDLITAEIHRRGLRETQKSARRATRLATWALVIGIVVGAAQIVITLAIAWGWIGDDERAPPAAPPPVTTQPG